MFYRIVDGLVSTHRLTLPRVEIEVFCAVGDADVRYRNEWHALNALLDGAGISNEISTEGSEPHVHDRPPGSLIFVPACAASRFRSFGPQATYCTVRISPALVYTVAHAAMQATVLPLRTVHPFFDPQMLEVVRRLAAIATGGPPESASSAEAATQALTGLILRRFAGPDEEITLTGGLSPSRMLRVVEFVRSKLAAPIGLEDMAGAAGLSVDRFRHAFKVSAGISPHRYLVSERVKRAQDLLVKTDAPLADVALDCGFGSQAHFTSTFRSVVGVTPGVFRRTGGRGVAAAAFFAVGLGEYLADWEIAARALSLVA